MQKKEGIHNVFLTIWIPIFSFYRIEPIKSLYSSFEEISNFNNDELRNINWIFTCYFENGTSSTRRFWALPSLSSLSAIGLELP